MGVEKMVAVGMEAGKRFFIDALLRRPLEMVPAESCFKSFHFLRIHLNYILNAVLRRPVEMMPVYTR